LCPIAEGGFGIVFRGEHRTFGDIAYKKLKATIIPEEDQLVDYKLLTIFHLHFTQQRFLHVSLLMSSEV